MTREIADLGPGRLVYDGAAWWWRTDEWTAADCGHHCGVNNGYRAHCTCNECHGTK